MATTKKKTSTKKKTQAPVEEVKEEIIAPVEEVIEEIASEEVIVKPEASVEEAPVKEKKSKKSNKKIMAPIVEEIPVEEPKYRIGSIVYVAKDADADLNGFKLFPQYKKYTYTVEAYDQITGVYTLRRLNLSLKLKEAFVVSPEERAHDSINRKQF